jgi:hypothetical protein
MLIPFSSGAVGSAKITKLLPLFIDIITKENTLSLEAERINAIAARLNDYLERELAARGYL